MVRLRIEVHQSSRNWFSTGVLPLESRQRTRDIVEEP